LKRHRVADISENDDPKGLAGYSVNTFAFPVTIYRNSFYGPSLIFHGSFVGTVEIQLCRRLSAKRLLSWLSDGKRDMLFGRRQCVSTACHN